MRYRAFHQPQALARGWCRLKMHSALGVQLHHQRPTLENPPLNILVAKPQQLSRWASTISPKILPKKASENFAQNSLPPP